MKAFCINCVCSLRGHHVCPPPSSPPLGVLVVKSNATVPFRGLFCCRPAGRLHLSPLLFMSPLTTCSPHSSTFSQRVPVPPPLPPALPPHLSPPPSLLLPFLLWLLFLLLKLLTLSPPLPPLHFTAATIDPFIFSFFGFFIWELFTLSVPLIFLTLRVYKLYWNTHLNAASLIWPLSPPPPPFSFLCLLSEAAD